MKFTKIIFIIISFFYSMTFAQTTEQRFSTASFFADVFYENNEIAYPISKLKFKLEELAKKNPLKNPLLEPNLVYTFVPFGRSLHAASTNFSHPRVLFGYSPSKYTTAARTDYKDLVDRLFVSYSELQNALEVISWNNYEGRFNFETVENYEIIDGVKQVFVEESTLLANKFTTRNLCMTCHQSGGPLYSDKPWSESNSAIGVSQFQKTPITEALEKALNSKFYKEIEIDPTDELGQRNLSASDIHAVVKNSHVSLINARRIAKQSCGKNIFCRETYLKAVLKLAQNGYYENQNEHFLMTLPFRKTLSKLIFNEWPQHQFSYVNPTLLNRDPFQQYLAKEIPEVNPSHKRELIDHIMVSESQTESLEYAAVQMLYRGYEGFGFLYSNLNRFKICSDQNLDELFLSKPFKEIVMMWNLNDSDTLPQKFEPLYFQILNLLKLYCGEEKK